MLWAEFVGPAYTARSQNLDDEALKNLYVETITSSGNAKRAMLLGTPALKFLQSADTAVCRGWFSQDNLTLFVNGETLYRFDPVNSTATAVGPIHDAVIFGSNLVSFASNGRGGEQVAITGGGFLYIYDITLGTLSAPIDLPLTNVPVQLGFLDGYFLLTELDTVRVWFSALEDGTLWDPIDFFARSQSSDNVVGLKVLRDKVWIFGSLTTDAYYDSGDADVPFVPYSGSLMQEGAVTPWAVGVQGELLIWLSQDNEGTGRMVTSGGDVPQRISTAPIEFALAGYQTVADAELLIYEQEGHGFACFSFPIGGTTWCYDARETAVRGEPTWHERQAYDEVDGSMSVWRARGLAQVANVLLTGDRFSTDLYTLSLDTFRDACGKIRRVRRSPYLSSENQWLFISQIELGIQGGVGTTDGDDAEINPEVLGAISRDSGHTFDPPMPAPLGAIGEYNQTASWFQCGRVRVDRFVFEVSMTAAVRCAWGPGLWLRADPGWGGR